MLRAYAGGLFPSQKHAGEGRNQGKNYGKAMVDILVRTYKERYAVLAAKDRPPEGR